MPPKGSTSKKMVRSSERAAGKVPAESVSARRRSAPVTDVIDIHDSESEGSEESSVEVTSKKERRKSAPVVGKQPAKSTRATRSSLDSSAPTASSSKPADKKLKIVLQDTPDEEVSSSASVVSADLSSDEESTGAGNNKERSGGDNRTRNSIPMCEVERAAVERMNNLSRYRKIFEPFVTPKVMGQLNNVLIEKQKRIQEGGTAAKASIEDLEERFVTERIPQPRCLSAICKMRDYQIEGFSWLVNNYYRSVNCILADEMGLGKTLQSIACVAHLALVKKLSGPYLFIVPLSVLFNWMNEFKKWCPSLRVVRLHSNDKDEQLRLRKILSNPDVAQIVVTTYDTVKAGGLCHALRCIVWRSVFLDEGHRIKNEDADVTKACHALRTRFRVILTGTPVQNNLHEFGALLSFLAPNIFTDLTLFDAAFNLKVAHKPKNLGAGSSTSDNSNKKSAETVKEEQAAAQQIDRALLANAHYMMKPFVLRRLKSEVEQKLPPKYETKINCPMTEVQKELTRALLFKEQALISRLDSCGSAPSAEVAGLKAWSGAAEGNGSAETIDKSRLMSLLAQLRKAANHPYLFPGVEKVAVDGLPTEEIVSACGKMQVLDKLLSQLYAKGHRVVLFSQYTRTLDILSDYLDLRGYKHSRLDGSTNRVMREVRINLFNRPQSPQFIFCLSTRAGGEGVNLFTADTVILYDSDWNPQVDIQAMARVHRIGQTKIVHVYRLISAGTVEECIVQRAQRKLFLDSMVNRGSTAQAKQEAEAAEALAQAQELAEKEAASGSKRKRVSVDLPEPSARTSARGKSARLSGAAETVADDDVVLNTATAEVPAAEEDAEESEPSKVFSAVRFGWNSVFSVNKNASKDLTDADIERIIDRTRGSKAEGTEEGAKTEEAATPAEGWQENQEYSLETFDEHAPLVSIHDLRVQETAATAADTEVPTADAGMATAGASKKAMRRSASAASIRSSGSFEIPSDGDLLDNANGDAAAGASSRPRRSISARTVDVMVEGVGLVKVSKFSLDNDDSAAGSKSAQDRRAARQAKQQEVLYITHSGRQVAGRDFEHQDICNECWDGGELLVCDICPMAFHPQCIGLTKIPTGFQWFCPHHQCATCMRRVSAASLLFRCECCSNAYCEDCLPAESTVQGESRRLEALGYRMSGNACYILCSLECKHFFETEVEPPTTVDAPHQMSIVQEWKNIGDGDASGDNDEGDEGSPTADAADGQEGFLGVMTSVDHALSNCALDDIRERLGFSQSVVAVPAVVAPAAPVVQAPAPSASSVVVDLTSSDSAPTSSAIADTGVANGAISAVPSSTNLTTVQPPVPPVPTVTPVNSRLKVRFTCLGEIPNFHLRFDKAGPRVKSLLFKLINDIMLYQERFLPAEATNGASSSKAAADTTAEGSAPAPEDSGEDEESVNMEKVKKDAYNHKGVHTSLSVQDIGKVFLHAVGTIARAQKFELFPLAEALGISFVTPILRNLKPSTDQSAADNMAKFLVEPKFSAIKDFSRQKLEEAIAALLVLPCPQNLLIYKSGMDKLPSNALPVDNLFLITRYLECLGENCNDGNNMFFASLTAKNKGMTQLRHWPAYYPLGSMAPSQLRNQWLGPAARLFAFLRQPYLNEDRGMRQTLIGVYRALYTPQGQAKPAVATNITSLGARPPNYGASNGDGAQSSGDDSDFKGPGARRVKTNGDQRPPAQQPGMQESMLGSLNYITPPMDSKHELQLFLRWLNAQYDAARKVPPPAPSAPANSLPRFPVNQSQRQFMMEKISLCLRGVLAGRDAAAVVECVRRCEYELLLRSPSYAHYCDLSTICHRIAEEVNLHREWGIAAVKVTTHHSMDTIEYDPTAPKDTTSWRSLITTDIRQDMIIRVEKMLRLVSKQLGIYTIEDLNHKIQQYEIGLVISSSSLQEYADKATLPKRLAGLVADFSEYKKTLPPSDFIASS